MKEQIQKLKKEKNAVILTHYYAPAEAQEVADYVGVTPFISQRLPKRALRILSYSAEFLLWGRVQRF